MYPSLYRPAGPRFSAPATPGEWSVPTEIDTVLVVAAESEARAVFVAHGLPDRDAPQLRVLRGGVWILRTGIGKANAAGALGIALSQSPAKRVVSLGLGGALPGSGLGIGEAVLATSSIFADEGIETPEGFVDCRSMGFPLHPEDRGAGFPPDQRLAELIGAVVEKRSAVATVSTCSGRDELAERVRRRTGAGVEAMEGAAVLLTCLKLGVPAAEVRVISNTTGDRKRQVWDIGRALAELGRVSVMISGALGSGAA